MLNRMQMKTATHKVLRVSGCLLVWEQQDSNL